MNLKKFNNKTLTWDIIASGNASGIVVTDPHFVGEDNVQKSVNDVLVEMDEKIEKTKRNLSWVVQNGTIGGGGGSGSGIDAQLIISNANIVVIEGNNILYAISESVTLGCLVKQNRSNQKYYVTVSLDGNTVISRQLVYSNVNSNLVIPNITQFTDRTSHSVVITAENDNGIALDPYFLTITESSIKTSVEKLTYNAKIGEAAYIQYIVTNKVLNANTTLIVHNQDIDFEKTYNLGAFTSNQPMTVNVNFFDVFPEGYQHTAGSTYTFKAYAQTIIGTEPVNSGDVYVQIVVEDSETLVVLVSNITDITMPGSGVGITPTQYEQSGNISFAFTPYLANVSAVYYALRILRGTFNSTTGEFAIDTSKDKIDVGIFDADLTNFDQNQYTLRGSTKIFNWAIPQEDGYLGDYLIQLRCWSDKGTPQTTKQLVCTVIQSSQSLYPTQMPEHMMYAQWHIKQGSFPTNPSQTYWESHVENFKYPGELEPYPNTTVLRAYDTNGKLSGFLTENGQSKLRLANEAYGIIDVRPFEKDPDSAEGINNWGKRGFTLSLTFKSDYHPFTDRTVFFLGDYDSEGEFQEGIYVGLEDVIWKYYDGTTKYTVSCKIQQNTVTSLDFVVDRMDGVETGELKIFVNGALNAAREINPSTGKKDGFLWHTNSRMYLACSCLDESNQIMDHFADVEFYDISLFTYPLNDFQIVVNSMNSRARGSLLPNGSVDFNQYGTWRTNNFMTDPEYVNSVIWNGDTRENNGFAYPDFDRISALTHIPVMHIACNGSRFEKAVYEKINAETDAWYSGCVFKYHDPSTGVTVTHNNASIAIQGTSSVGYRSKNIEIKFINEETGLPDLFRPKESWLPESQFTLKADVVDSAHANNAAIGKWINDNSDKLFDKTPPMQVWDANKPINSGVGDHKGKPHSDKMKIKHTLEGFPVLFIITFDKTSQQEMLGIYSFNLGRASYYNMGMKFLKSFTHDNLDTELTVDKLPAFVTAYEEYGQNELFGNIKQSEIYSYEFGQNSNIIEDKNTGETQYTALFMQHHESVLKHVGEFKFNGGEPNNPASAVTAQHVWDRLKDLFHTTARMTGEQIDQYLYDSVVGGYVKTGSVYNAQSDWGTLSAELARRINLKNAYSYFLICVAFGLVDSLGKNMVLRSWNVKDSETDELTTWWPCFYDMDTATGLSNTGEENVAKVAYIDKFTNGTNSEGMNTLSIIQNSAEGGYDTYSSRLWDVLRDSRFINTGSSEGLSYDTIWSDWRQDTNLIGINATSGESGITKFMNECFKSQTSGCGELLYNYDYRVKYLTKYYTQSLVNGQWVTSDKATYGNVQFLHGTRANYVNDWLNRRMIFFDGVYQYKVDSNILPYNNQGRFSCWGAEESNGKLIVKTNSPVIMEIIFDSTRYYRYFVNENVETMLILHSLSGNNTQITLNNLSEISLLDGLKDLRFAKFMDGIKLYSLAELDLSNTKTLDSEPVDFNNIFVKTIGYDADNNPIYSSDLRHIDLSNTEFASDATGNDFPVVINNCTKLKTVDISNSCVKSISLPNASLTKLLINNSQVTQIDLTDQPFLTDVDFTGCSKMTKVSVTNCAKMERLDLSNMSNLTSVEIIGCPSLREVIAPSCARLTNFSVSGAPELEEIDLSGCTNVNLSISIATSSNLKKLNLTNTKTAKPVIFTAGFNSLTELNLSGSNINAFQFGSSVNNIATYNGEYVLDLSGFNLTDLVLTGNSLKYIKFKNSKTNPFAISDTTFDGCTNLTRVFGHIKLTSSSSFYGGGSLSNFTLHGRANDEVPTENDWYGPDTDVDSTGWDDNTNLQTNVTLATSSLQWAFRETACNMFDVYYILWKAKNVTSLHGTFYECTKCVTNLTTPLRRDTFKHCGNVTNATYLFYQTNIGGPLYSPSHNGDTITAYDGLFSYLKNLKTTTYMFLTSETFYIDDLLFYKCSDSESLQIESLNNLFAWDTGDKINVVDNTTNLTASNASSKNAYARASKLFRHLPKLRSITNTFNNMRLNFDTEEYQGVTFCPLIAYNKELTSISGCLLNIVAKGNLSYVFGGNEIFDDSGLFPRGLTTINGFIYVTSYSGSKVYCPIHNNMFRQINKSLISFGHYPTSGASAYPNEFSKNVASLNGPGLNKKFLQEDDEIFPLNIFKECKNLQRMEYLFYGLTSDIGTSADELSLPGDMFLNNTQLFNIDGCFANMATNIHYTLTGRGFINCNLSSVRYCFDEGGVDRGNKVGGIPYGLFYQERSSEFIFNDGWDHDDAIASDVSDTKTYPAGSVLPTAKKYTQKLKKIRNTISDMTGALRYFAGKNATGYTRQTYAMDSIETAGDVIVQNQAYDPREYIKNPKYNVSVATTDSNYNPYYVIKNPAYSPYLYEWNIYYPDGTVNMGEEIESSTLYSKVLNGTITSLSSTIPAELYDTKTVSGTMTNTRETSRNYICSPDLFRYCANSSTVILNDVLGYSTNFTSGSVSRLTNGIHGRIPSVLFRPLTNATSLKYVFRHSHNVTPHIWGTDAETGHMVPEDLFKYNTKVTDLQGMFIGLYIPNNVTFPGTLFNQNTALQNVSFLFYDCIFNYTGSLSENLFQNNKQLNNISYMFAASSNSAVPANNNIKSITSGLFKASSNPNLSIFSGFLRYQKNTAGTVPAFWTWASPTSANKTNVFLGVSKSKITNSEAIISAGWGDGMVD